MLESFRFHHIGLAVKSIAQTSKVYELGGYARSKTTCDPVQHVNVCWLTKEGMPMVELIEPVDDDAPVCRILGKNRAVLYHTGYVVEDICMAETALRRKGYILVTPVTKAAAINGSNICFLFNKDVGLIELVEQPAEITM